MKGLRKVLTPFAPDQSGAVSVLYDLGGILVICDAGGCSGNICGFDEPRWTDVKSAVFSAGLRDMDAILGRDERLVAKLKNACERIGANFAAVIGTPVPAVIGTDFTALARMAERETGLPVIPVAANGMRLYDEGEEEAFLSLFRTVSKEPAFTDPKRIGVIGAVPMELSPASEGERIRDALKNEGWERVSVYGNGASFDEAVRAGEAAENLVVSPAGIAAAEYLKERFHIPYRIGYPVAEDLLQWDTAAGKRILIVHQQVVAHSIRERLYSAGAKAAVCATFFKTVPELLREGDRHLAEEDDFSRLAETGEFDMIIADPVLQPLCPGFSGEWAGVAEFAVSGKQVVA